VKKAIIYVKPFFSEIAFLLMMCDNKTVEEDEDDEPDDYVPHLQSTRNPIKTCSDLTVNVLSETPDMRQNNVHPQNYDTDK